MNNNSNRDYATENINLKQQIIDLKVANKDKAETIKSMKQELLEYSQLRDRFKVLYEENQKLKQDVKDVLEDYKDAATTMFKLDKAIEILKDKLEFEDLGEMQSGNVYRPYFNDCFDQQEYDLLKEVLE